MAIKRGDKKSVRIDGNLTGDSILGDGSVIHKPTINNNNVDGEELGQSISEAISNTARRSKLDELHRESDRQESREIMETVFVSFVSGIAMGAFWKATFPLNAEIVPFFVIATVIFFNIARITRFGLRHSIVMVSLLAVAFILLLEYTVFIQSWMNINQFVGTAILSTIGAGIGLVIGFVQLFWKPLGD